MIVTNVSDAPAFSTSFSWSSVPVSVIRNGTQASSSNLASNDHHSSVTVSSSGVDASIRILGAASSTIALSKTGSTSADTKTGSERIGSASISSTTSGISSTDGQGSLNSTSVVNHPVPTTPSLMPSLTSHILDSSQGDLIQSTDSQVYPPAESLSTQTEAYTSTYTSSKGIFGGLTITTTTRFENLESSIETTDSRADFVASISAGFPGLGTLTLIGGPFVLGVPTPNLSSAFRLPQPYDNVQILIPAGAWQDTKSRRSGAQQLSAAALSLVAGAQVPGAQCGPAVWLGPKGQELLTPLTLSLPCANISEALLSFGSVASHPLGFAYDNTIGRWKPLSAPSGSLGYNNGTLWTSVPALGLFAAFWVLTPAPLIGATDTKIDISWFSTSIQTSNSSAKLTSNSNQGSGGGIGSILAAVAGAAAGGACVAITGVAAWLFVRQKRKRSEGHRTGDKKISDSLDATVDRNSSSLVYIAKEDDDSHRILSSATMLCTAEDAQPTHGAAEIPLAIHKPDAKHSVSTGGTGSQHLPLSRGEIDNRQQKFESRNCLGSNESFIEISHSPHSSQVQRASGKQMKPGPLSSGGLDMARIGTGVSEMRNDFDKDSKPSRANRRRRSRKSVGDSRSGSVTPTQPRSRAVLALSDGESDNSFSVSVDSQVNVTDGASKATAIAAAAAYADELAAVKGWPVKGAQVDRGSSADRGTDGSWFDGSDDHSPHGVRPKAGTQSSHMGLSARQEHGASRDLRSEQTRDLQQRQKGHRRTIHQLQVERRAPDGPVRSSQMRLLEESPRSSNSIGSRETRTPMEILAAAVADRDRRTAGQASKQPVEHSSIYRLKNDRGWPAPRQGQLNLNESHFPNGPKGTSSESSTSASERLLTGNSGVSDLGSPSVGMRQGSSLLPTLQRRPGVQIASGGWYSGDSDALTKGGSRVIGGSGSHSGGRSSDSEPYVFGPAATVSPSSSGSQSQGSSSVVHGGETRCIGGPAVRGMPGRAKGDKGNDCATEGGNKMRSLPGLRQMNMIGRDERSCSLAPSVRGSGMALSSAAPNNLSKRFADLSAQEL